MSRYLFLQERVEKYGGPWRASDAEFLPFHPSASHVPPEWRDGWNSCFLMAQESLTTPPREDECDRCHGDGMDPWCDYLLPCPACGGRSLP